MVDKITAAYNTLNSSSSFLKFLEIVLSIGNMMNASIKKTSRVNYHTFCLRFSFFLFFLILPVFSPSSNFLSMFSIILPLHSHSNFYNL